MLAMMVALGSPGIYIDRAFKYQDPRETLAGQEGRYHQAWDPSSTYMRQFYGRSMVVLQYILLLGSVADVALVSWDLGRMAICMVGPSFIYFPLTWALIGILVHVVGAIVLRLRARRAATPVAAPAGKPGQHRRGLLFQVLHRLRTLGTLEFSLLGKQAQNGEVIQVEWLDESVAFLVIAWFHSLCCVSHLIYGTVIFSGVIFLGPLDAFLVFLRYLVSCLLCRIILMYELVGLREAYNSGGLLPGVVPPRDFENKDGGG